MTADAPEPAPAAPARKRKPKARQDGEGSVFQVETKHGTRWRASKSYQGVDGAGKPARRFITGTGATPQEAVARRDANWDRFRVRTGQAPQSILREHPTLITKTVADVMYEWHKSIRPNEIAESTNRQYLTRIELHIIPALGHHPVRLLTNEHIEEFVHVYMPSRKKPDGTPWLSSNSARLTVFRVLSMGMDYAVRKGYLTVNPCKHVKAEKKKSVPLNLSTKSWVPRHLLRRVEDHPDEARWMLALIYGMRQGEVLGLTDDCLVLTGKQPHIKVRQQLSRKDIRHGCGQRDAATLVFPCGEPWASNCTDPIGGGGYYVKPETKSSNGVRDIPLVEPVLSVLRDHVMRQRAFRRTPEFKPKLTGIKAQDDKLASLIFTGSTGKPRRPQDDNRIWAKLLKENDVPHFRGHISRALSVTLLVEELHVPIEKVRRIIGDSEEVLRQYYLSVSREAVRDDMTLFAGSLSRLQQRSLRNDSAGSADDAAGSPPASGEK